MDTDTTPNTTPDITNIATVELIDTYLAAYGEPDPARRRELIEAAFTSDAVLADPPFIATGLDELHATFAAVQDQFPGHRFRRRSDVDQHHDAARYRWSLDGPDGTSAITGHDVVMFADGKIRRVTGFFGDQEAT